jgi:Ca-activated chloride channel family protein
MVVDRPAVLFALALLVPVAVLWRLSRRRGRGILEEVGGTWRLGALMDVYQFKSFFSFLFLALFVAVSVLALTGIRWGETLVEERRGEREIVFLVDVSNSMLARDVPPEGMSRLEKARETIRRVARSMGSTRFAVVAFKGAAVQLLPLTEDAVALESLLRYLGPAVMTTPGTDIEGGLKTALGAFSQGRRPYRAVLLFSDGESLAGNPNAAALRAAQEQVPVYVCAAGSEEGSIILLPGGQLLRDGEGEAVISRLRREPLERIAALSGGELFTLREPVDKVAAAVVSSLRGTHEGEQLPGLRRVKKDRYRLFLALALGFLTLSLLVRAVRWRDTL